MKILALEFSSAQRSVAISDSRHLSEVTEAGAAGTNAIGMIEQALCSASLEREQIDCLAVGLGPGSYTGIRSAIALAQGWQLASGVKLLGISSADAIAAQARIEEISGGISVVIDAQRGEFYLGQYVIEDDAARAVSPLRLASADEVRACEAAGDLLIGPEAPNWFPGGRIIVPRAGTVARLAAARTDFIPGEAMEPIYLREARFVKAPSPRKYS